MCCDVGEGVLGAVIHEDPDGSTHSHSMGVQPTGEGVREVIHLSKCQRFVLRRVCIGGRSEY